EEILLSSTGTYNKEAAEVALIIRHSTTGSSSTGTDPIVLELFDGAIFCGGDAKMVGASYIELNGATAHINGSLTMTGSAQFRNNGFVSTSTSMTLAGYPQIYADVAVPQTPKIPWGSVGSFIHGTVSIGPVPEQMIELDLEPFRLFAKATDTPGMNYKKAMAWNYQYRDSYISADEINKKLVVSGSSAVNVVPPGGVLWVEGDIKFAGSVNIYACVVATGNIEVKGASVHLQPGGLPSFMSLNGTVEIGAGCKVYGLVYSHNGDIKISGDAAVTGAFICPRGDFTHLGSGKVLYENSRPYGPNGVDVMLPKPDAGEPDGPPEIVGWVK
ncbi:MAG: hypothetical protein KAU94_01440, partial [Verrucomicrobia bacterium]|nr:hypothetical protein [Verrucomicrobiota bacterium]